MSVDVLSTITAVLGDDDGGPHMKLEIDSLTASQDLSDEQVSDFREAAKTAFRRAFGSDAKQIVVMVEDAA
jgi:hypothetical protein